MIINKINIQFIFKCSLHQIGINKDSITTNAVDEDNILREYSDNLYDVSSVYYVLIYIFYS